MSDTDPLRDLSSCVLCGYELRDERVVRSLRGTTFVLHPRCAAEGLEGVGLDSPHGIEEHPPDPVPEDDADPGPHEPQTMPSASDPRESPGPAQRPRRSGPTRLDDFT